MSRKLCVFVLLVIVFGTGMRAWPGEFDDIVGTRPSESGSIRVFAFRQGPEGVVTDMLSRREVGVPSLDPRQSSARGLLSWKIASEWVDTIGHKHVTYQQHFLPAKGTVTLPEEYSVDGVPLDGGLLTFHYKPGGDLWGVKGALIEDVESIGRLAVTSATAALEEGGRMFERDTGIAVLPLSDLDDDLAKGVLEDTGLKAYSKGNGLDFEFFWEVTIATADGNWRRAALHGETGKIVAHWGTVVFGNCIWQNNTNHAALAEPQNPLVSEDRDVWASPSTAGLPSFTHEALFPPEGNIPRIAIFRGTGPSDQCAVGLGGVSPIGSYSKLFPLPSVGGIPYYGGDSPNRSAGDAIFKTHQTMTSLYNELGWNSFNNLGSVAKVVVEPAAGSFCGANPGNAGFNHLHISHAPKNSVMVCPPRAGEFSASAALDVIAHEWGHGVLYARGIDREIHIRRWFHEGWSDVMGYGFEWKHEGPDPGGYFIEAFDWGFAEDQTSTLTPVREADEDDGLYDPVLQTGKYRYHVLDEDPCVHDDHHCGHPIPVAMYLAAVGGENPVCENQNLSGCGGDEVTQMPGATDTESIDKTVAVFLRAMAVYLDKWDDWETVTQVVRVAAHDVFSTSVPCDDALDEQRSISEAFLAIGCPAGEEVCVCPSCAS